MRELNPGILIIFGIGVFGGIISALMAKRLSVPQVLGYILVGILIGEGGFKLVTANDITALSSFNFFALGVIGFLVGAEIRFSILKKYGRQFASILAAEGLLTFVFVGVPITFILYNVMGSWPGAIAAGIIFGAIASATDPASTMSVIWEYRSAGILTTTLIAIVALDDALAMTLYGLGTGIARILTGGEVTWLIQFSHILLELFGAVFMGIFAAFIMHWILRLSDKIEVIIPSVIGLLLLTIGVAVHFNLDVIMASMSMGLVMVNMDPERSAKVIHQLKNFSDTIYILFFVLVGARLTLYAMPVWLWLIIIVYVVSRTLGKVLGAWIGAVISKAPIKIRQYSGLGLFAQGGVAIGLSIMASQHLNEIVVTDSMSLGDVIIFGVTTTTFLVQLMGPPLVKWIVKKSGEAGRNVTIDDVLADMKVDQVLNDSPVMLNEELSIEQTVKIMAESDQLLFPVVDNTGKWVGLLSVSDIRQVLPDTSLWKWMLCSDIMTDIHKEILYNDMPLNKAMALMNQLNYSEYVILERTTGKISGILNYYRVMQNIEHKILGAQIDT
jgi:Kef-type K+ transport system membrane component KefB/predicted transcriptional regulator